MRPRRGQRRKRHENGKTYNSAPQNSHLSGKKYNTPECAQDGPTDPSAFMAKRNKQLRLLSLFFGFFGTHRASLILNKQVGPLPPARYSYPPSLPPSSSTKASGFPQPLASSLLPRSHLPSALFDRTFGASFGNFARQASASTVLSWDAYTRTICRMASGASGLSGWAFRKPMRRSRYD